MWSLRYTGTLFNTNDSKIIIRRDVVGLEGAVREDMVTSECRRRPGNPSAALRKTPLGCEQNRTGGLTINPLSTWHFPP